jgi:hypothetical protein
MLNEWTPEQVMTLVATICEGGPSRTVLTALLGFMRAPSYHDVIRLESQELLSVEKIDRLNCLSRLLFAASESIDNLIMKQDQLRRNA